MDLPEPRSRFAKSLNALKQPPAEDWKACALQSLFGAVAALGHVPFALPVATVVAFAVLMAALSLCGSWKPAVRLGLFFGFGYFAVSFVWLVEPFLIFPSQHGWMAPFAVGLMAGGLAALWAAACGLAFMLGTGPATRSLALACLITAAGALREVLFTGFPWGLPAYVWGKTPVAQLLAFIGPHGLTLATLLVAACPVLFARRWAGFGLAVLLIGAGWLFGIMRVPSQQSVRADATIVRVVQPNVPQEQKWNLDRRSEFFLQLLELSRPDEGGSKLDLVVWPETSVLFPLHDEIDEIPIIAQETKGATTAFGVRRFSDDEVYNSLAVVAPNGRVAGTYDKRHLVPFGEYLPFGELLSELGIAGLVEGAGGFSAGSGPNALDFGAAGRFQVLICYEIVFPREVRARERHDGLLQVTNDAWFGSFSGPQQHFAQSRMRAIELGLPLIRSANTGISAIVDPYGRAIAQLPLGEQGAIDAELPEPLPPTVYHQLGDIPVGIAWILVMGVLALRRAVRLY